jgi:hypothetical protein
MQTRRVLLAEPVQLVTIQMAEAPQTCIELTAADIKRG